MEIIIDPRTRYNYSSFYLKGLHEIFGNAIKFDIQPFKELHFDSEISYNAGLPFILKDSEKIHKFFIDFEDVAKIEYDRYEWCDIYAKINAEFDWADKYEKIFVIGPSFGITLGNKYNTLKNCLIHYFQSKNYTKISFKMYLRDYIYSFVRRCSLEKYEEKISTYNNYIFHASTLWYNTFAKTDTNRYRGEFLKACKKAGLQIEGGLFYIGDSPDILKEMPDYSHYKTEYKDFIYNQRLSIDDYILKTKKSVLVFNTPSVCECHGWKLAEYLCMGKAIISTPLNRAMPGEGLQHGKNIHIVNSSDDIYDAIMLIKKDEAYRKKLEKGARDYYELYLSPKQAIKRLIEKKIQINDNSFYPQL